MISLNEQVVSDESFQWDECFVTGLTEVDEQHHQLVNVINRFGRLVTKNDPFLSDDIHTVFHDLSEYSVYHFQEEEMLMGNSAIDERHYRLHIKEHKNFLQEVVQIQKGFAAKSQKSARSLLKFLIHWLAYHILGSDQSMARQIQAIRAGITPTRAYEQEQVIRNEAMGPLVRALNGLVLQISERNRDLNSLNQTLELRVQERTRELEEANRKLAHLAMTDQLTNLPNRRHAMQALADFWFEAVEKNKPLSLLMLDADNFKQINDSSGHDAGDTVLRQLSRKLREVSRTDDVVCRLGGDEFLILCPNTPPAGAMMLAEKIVRTVNEMRVSVTKNTWIGSVSIGVASKTDDMKNPEELMKAADDGVYQAKKMGRNTAATSQNYKPIGL